MWTKLLYAFFRFYYLFAWLICLVQVVRVGLVGGSLEFLLWLAAGHVFLNESRSIRELYEDEVVAHG